MMVSCLLVGCCCIFVTPRRLSWHGDIIVKVEVTEADLCEENVQMRR